MSTLERLKEEFSCFSENYEQFLRAYPENIEGFHHRQFESGKLQLTLVNGDVHEGLSQVKGLVDVWFLDGFAPAKNPEMWQPNLFELMSELSHKGTTFSTFTAAAQVRRDLTAAGFVCEKVKGFAYKREMLRGSYSQESDQSLLLEDKEIFKSSGTWCWSCWGYLCLSTETSWF